MSAVDDLKSICVVFEKIGVTAEVAAQRLSAAFASGVLPAGNVVDCQLCREPHWGEDCPWPAVMGSAVH